jgi:cysteinyl-tRNA synthetase
VAALVELGCDMAIKDKNGRTGKQLAEQQGHRAVLERLREARRKPKHGYSLQGDAAGVVYIDFEAVHGILADRVQAKRAQDYTLCDELRAVLKNEHQVLIDDKTRTWRVTAGQARPLWTSVAFHTIISSNCCARCAC